jgi:hypothetical protein
MRIRVAAMALLSILIVSCGSDDPPSSTRSFIFGMREISDDEGRFVAVTSNPDVLAKLEAELALPADQRSLHIHGAIATGSGGHNLSWHWHFVPDEWDLVEISIELCDGTPQLVEEDVDYWVETIGAFCPWASYVQGEQ